MKMKTIGVKLLVIFGLLLIPTAMQSGNNYFTYHTVSYLNRYWDEKTQQVVTETVEKKVQKLNRFHVLTSGTSDMYITRPRPTRSRKKR